MDAFRQDLRYGWRMLVRSPGFTALAMFALALGIGANTAVFSVVDGVLLRPLPYPEPERLATVWMTLPEPVPASAGDFTGWREGNEAFVGMAAFHSQPYVLKGGVPEILGGVRCSAELFSVLGIPAALGRTILPEEDRAGAARVAVLGHALWQRRFAGDPAIVGKPISLDDVPHTVVGVMPAGFQFPRRGELPSGFQFPLDVDVYTPLAWTPAQAANRGREYLAVVGRLAPGVTLAQAQTVMDATVKRMAQELPATSGERGARVVSLREQVLSRVAPGLLMLLGAVALVLLIACANVANLVLVRASTRSKEMAIRAALGAGRGRVMRQLLTESLLLALSSGAVALLLAVWGVELLRRLLPDTLPRVAEIGVDARVFGFTLVVSLVSGILFGLAPALETSSPRLAPALQEGGRSGGETGSRRLRAALVVGEVALALVLLCGAGLLLRSFVLLGRVDSGVDPKNVLAVDVRLPRTRYEPPRQAAFFEELLARLRGAPGVRAVAAIYPLPLSGADEGATFRIDGRAVSPDDHLVAGPRLVSPGYFETMGIPVVRGRGFAESDRADAPATLVINEAMVRAYFPAGDPIGQRLMLTASAGQPWREIVGVIRDVHHRGLDEPSRPEMYFPFAQFPTPGLTLVLRTEGAPRRSVAAVESAVRSIDADQPLGAVRTMDELLTRSVAGRRFPLLLLATFATLALVLAAVGIYGVMSFLVAQRRHEIGVRMALGAEAKDVRRLVVGQGMRLVLAGLALGALGAFALTRVLRGLLFAVSATDPLTFGAVALLLVLVALAACWIPARRATRIDPLAALRYD
jgi:putative ABC transport system permease protein